MVQHQHCKRSSLCLKIKNCCENLVICALNVSWITQKIELVGLFGGSSGSYLQTKLFGCDPDSHTE